MIHFQPFSLVTVKIYFQINLFSGLCSQVKDAAKGAQEQIGAQVGELASNKLGELNKRATEAAGEANERAYKAAGDVKKKGAKATGDACKTVEDGIGYDQTWFDQASYDQASY